MKKRMFVVGALAAALVLVSCSSAPPRSDTVTDVKNQASDDERSGESYFRQGRYDLALQFFSNALSSNTSVDNVAGIIRCSISIGQVYLATGRTEEAFDMFSRARERARGSSVPLFIDASISLGELYLRKDDPQNALTVFQEALAAGGSAPAAGTGSSASTTAAASQSSAKGPLTSERTGVLYHNIGSAYKGSGDLPAALEWLGKALQIDLANKHFLQVAADYYMIASVYSKQGDYPAAARNAQAALDTDKKIESSPGIAQDLRALGLIARKNGDTAGAYDYFQRSYLVFSTLGMKAEMKRTLGELAETADSLGRTEEAQKYRALLAQTGAQ